MLINFKFKNWMSFRDEVEFSMVADSENENHLERIPKIDKYGIRILPIAAIYGGNDSGKTNFIDAFEWVSTFIRCGVLLDYRCGEGRIFHDKKEVRSQFSLCFLHNETIYKYSFSMMNDKDSNRLIHYIIEEELVEIDPNESNDDKVLFHRYKDTITIGKNLKKHDMLESAFKTVDVNGLFVYELHAVYDYEFPIISWLKDNVENAHLNKSNLHDEYRIKKASFYKEDDLGSENHTLLTRKLIERYLDHECSEESRKQIVFTTHDVMLLDKDLLRTDEIWVIDKCESVPNYEGVSNMMCLREYEDAEDYEDIRDSYLKGRFGGIPLL